ncbi:MAG: suppressor for copper-sensitivity [Acidobacteriota bacterium]|jgi:DsbC/DsbD-like thiol-disulfide interchange protein|nr:suppressor for copper-sensitivity [Acidobacteriota bacterium]
MTAPRIAFLSAIAAVALTLLAPRPARGAAGEWSVNDQSKVRLITAWKVAPKSGEMWMGLQFALSPGWHVYWKNSGDAGFPPAVTFQPADVLGKPELLWPTPSRFNLPGDLVAFGYEREVIYPVRAEIKPKPAAAPTPPGGEQAAAGDTRPGDTMTITADLDYLVCEVDCVPHRCTLTVEQPVGDPPEADREMAQLLQGYLDRLPRNVTEVAGVTTGAVLDASRPAAPELEIRVLGARAEAGKTDLFLETQDALDAGRPRMKVTPDGLVFHVPMKPRETNKPLPARTPVAWTISNLLAKDGHSFSLEARRDVDVWSRGGPPAAGAGDGEPAAAPGRLARLLLSALLGGALLNLMPPVLALLLAELLVLRAGAGEGSGRVREGAAAATTGIVGAAWGLAALALAAHRSGLPAGWGAQLQEPMLGAVLAVALAVLALNLWGVIEVPLALTSPANAAVGTGRHLLAGLFTTPLALACPVPLLDEPLGYALTRGPVAVAAFFAVVGFGLALPYLLLTVLPAAVRALPAPGSWTPRLREGLGFLAGGGTFWALYALAHQVSPEGLAGIELALLALALLAWLRHRQGSGRALRTLFALGLLACAVGIPWLAGHNRVQKTPTTATTQLNPGG